MRCPAPFQPTRSLVLAWLGRIGGSLLHNEIPTLENATTLVIQAMDWS